MGAHRNVRLAKLDDSQTASFATSTLSRSAEPSSVSLWAWPSASAEVMRAMGVRNAAVWSKKQLM